MPNPMKCKYGSEDKQTNKKKKVSEQLGMPGNFRESESNTN